MTRITRKVANIAAVGALASAAAMYVARDVGGSPRDRTRAETSLSTAREPRAVAPAALAPVAAQATSREATLTTTELESEIAASEAGARDLVLEAALPSMVANNAREIARFAELQTDPHLREIMFRHVAQLWAKIDADQAMAWARSVPDPSERDAALIDVSLSLASIDPQRAVTLREQELGNVESDGVLAGLVQQWAEKDFDAALAWTNGRPAGAQRDELVQRLAFVQATRGQTAQAADLARDSIHSPETRAEALATVAQLGERGQPADSRHDSMDL